jgi:hypothetical protein
VFTILGSDLLVLTSFFRLAAFTNLESTSSSHPTPSEFTQSQIGPPAPNAAVGSTSGGLPSTIDGLPESGELPSAISSVSGELPGTISSTSGELPGTISSMSGELPGAISSASGGPPSSINSMSGGLPGAISSTLGGPSSKSAETTVDAVVAPQASPIGDKPGEAAVDMSQPIAGKLKTLFSHNGFDNF